MKRIIIPFMLLWSVKGSAQFSSTSGNVMNIQNEVPPSPTAASLGKYGDFPVSESSGIPQINIPIADIRAGGVSVPVSLSYHASGIKVNDVPSWVGSGFALNAGGVITRSVKGKPDDQSDGYLYKRQYVEDVVPNIGNIASSNPTPGLYATVAQAASGDIDFEPDEFFYNVGGLSGKFTLTGESATSGLTITAITAPYDNIDIKVDFSYSIQGFTITDANGVRYKFDKKEDTYRYSLTSTEPSGPENNHTSSWYLSTITDPLSGAIINFDYDTETVVNDKYWSFQRDRIFNVASADPNPVEPTLDIATRSFNASSEISALRLRKITYPSGSVVFNPQVTAREDISGAKALDNICFYDNNNVLTRKVKFSTAYFSAATGGGSYMGSSGAFINKRLKLVALQELNPQTSVLESEYKFEYNATNLPPRGSIKQDLWGYYQPDCTDTFPIATLIYSTPIGSGPTSISVSDVSRMPASTMAAAANTLTKIVYPTGGSSEFEYENNTYGQDPSGSITDTLRETVVKVNATGISTTSFATPVITPFTLTANTRVKVSCFMTRSKLYTSGSGEPPTPCIPDKGYTYLKKGGSFFTSFTPGEYYIDLGPGTYNFESTIIEELCEDALMKVNLTYEVTTGYRKYRIGPGIRIKKIIERDPYNTAVSKETEYLYNYDSLSDRSSGVLLSKPTSSKLMIANTTNGGNPVAVWSFQRFYSYCIGMLTGHQGSFVSYNQVTRRVSATGENGRTVNTYSNVAAIYQPAIPEAPPYNEFYRRGLLKETRIYNSSNILQLQKEYTYLIDRQQNQQGAYVYFSTIASGGASSQSQYGVFKYKIPSARVLLSKEITTEYLTGGNVNTVTDYTYNNSVQTAPSSVKTTNQDGTYLKTVTRYPLDFTIPSGTISAELAGIKTLLEKRMYHYPIEQYEIKNSGSDLVISGNYLTYLSSTPGAVDVSYKLNLTQPVSGFTPAAVSGTSISKDSRYKNDITYSQYLNSTWQQAEADGSQFIAKLYYDPYQEVLAAVAGGAEKNKIAFTSFEDGFTGGWTYASGGISASSFLTGTKSYNLSSGNITATIPPGNYIISYWRRSGTSLANGVTPVVSGATSGGWSYCEHHLSGVSSLTLSGTGVIDELRTYPEGASMRSYTYKPLVGMLSSDSESNNLLFYGYDALGRLTTIKDQNGKILTQYTYQVQGTE